jgi:transcriptional regulator with XRE-family HTH domain
MGRKRGSQSTAVISDELHARIVRLAELFWESNQSRMGRDVGVDQSALSKMLAGKQQPSAMLLERLANWPGVNAAWLMSGRGEPRLDTFPASGAGQYRPLFEELQADRLRDRPAVRAGVGYPVAGAQYTETSYWLRVPVHHPVTVGTDVRHGDLLLLETDPAWTGSIANVRGRMVVLGNPDPKASPRAVMGAVNSTPEADDIDNKAVSDVYAIALSTGQPEPGARPRVWLVLPGDRKAVREATSRFKEPVVTLDDVLAVRVALLRPSW